MVSFGPASNVVVREEGSGLEESECIRAVMAGHRNAYGELVRTYQGMVYRVCLKMTGHPHSAEDLGQEVFIKAYDALQSFRFDASFSTWLYQIAVRTCLDWRRRQQVEQRRQSRLMEQVDAQFHVDTPELKVIASEQTEAVEQMVGSLKEPYRTVIVMFYERNLSYQEIAAKTGTSVKTVESRLYRARQMMRDKGDGLR